MSQTTVEPRVAVPTLTADPEEVRLLLRWLTVMLFVAAALGACVWTRMAVRQTALELDAARSALVRAEIERERLLVERSLLRDPGRLAGSAEALGLVAPAATLTVTEGAVR
jgi:cell division protein FtsL